MYIKIKLDQCDTKHSNFVITPRKSDGKLINGSYNRVWLLDKKIGTLNTLNSFWVGFIKGDTLNYRKLTSMEMWLLQGFSSKDYSAALSVSSESALIKQAGNTIHIPTLVKVFKKELKEFIGDK